MIEEKMSPEEKEERKKSRRQNKIMSDILVPNIDYSFWLNKSKTRQDSVSNGTFSDMTSLLSKRVKKGDILWDVLNDKNRSKQTMNGIIKKSEKLFNILHKKHLSEISQEDIEKRKDRKKKNLYLKIIKVPVILLCLLLQLGI
jgi:predicted transcriptional regulator